MSSSSYRYNAFTSWSSSPSSHYDALGVSQTATKEEIKKAYRKLCMSCHPDVAPKGSASAEKFKRISEAHRVLSDDNARRLYNLEMNSSWGHRHRHGGGGGFSSPSSPYGGGGESGFGARPRQRASSSSATGAMHILEGIYKPRNMVLGVTLGLVAVSCIKSVIGDARDDGDAPFERRSGRKNLVEAWKNPETDEWEQPAPWDERYRRLRPELHLVPRELVRRRDRG